MDTRLRLAFSKIIPVVLILCIGRAWAGELSVGSTIYISVPTNTAYIDLDNNFTTDQTFGADVIVAGLISGAAGITDIGTVNVSTSATSSLSLCFLGAFQTLPTADVNEGCLAFQKSDHSIYLSTETVVSVQSWLKL